MVNRERMQAVTHCPQGHPYTAENTYFAARGSRNCRVCGRARAKLRKAAARELRADNSRAAGTG
jgi:hypothetical protein